MQAFQEQQYNSGGLRNRGGAGGPQEGTYASAAQTQTPATLNRLQRTRMEEEEDLRLGVAESRSVRDLKFRSLCAVCVCFLCLQDIKNSNAGEMEEKSHAL